MDDRKIVAALDKSIRQINKGHYGIASKTLRKALGYNSYYDYFIRNNLGQALAFMGDFTESRRVLEGNLKQHKMQNSYFFALLSEVEFGVGHLTSSKKFFKKSIQLYEKDKQHIDRENQISYGLNIMKAGLLLQDYKSVLSFYKTNCKKLNYNELHMYAGLAAQNLKRYDQAIQYFERISGNYFTEVPKLMRDKGLPHKEFVFNLVDAFSTEPKEGSVETMLIIMDKAVHQNDGYEVALEIIINNTGQWARVFADWLFLQADYSRKVKHMVLDLLIELGLHDDSQPQLIIDHGEELTIYTEHKDLIEDDLVTMALVSEIEAIEKREGREQAFKAFHEKTRGEKYASPQMLLLIYKLSMRVGKVDYAESILRIMEKYQKDIPSLKSILTSLN